MKANMNITKRFSGKNIQFTLLLLPPLVCFFVGMIVPLLMGFFDSFTDWDGLSMNKNYVGIKNYLQIFKDIDFVQAFHFTILFMIFNTLIQNTCALLFAVLMDSNIKAKKLYRTIIFIPALLSPILVGQIWTKMYAVVLPSLNELFGTNINFKLFASPDTVLSGLVYANNWQWIGYWMLIYLAGLQGIPKDLYEACTVDGGNWFRKFYHVTLPMLAPSITICTIGIATGSLKVYELIVASTGGGPGHSSQSIIMYIYNTAFGLQQPAYASALSVVFLILLVIFALVQLVFLRRREVQL